MKLYYSREAIADLQRLHQFIAKENPVAAQRISTDLISRLEYLSLFPKMGRSIQKTSDSERVRDFIFGNYIVRYVLDGRGLTILRIWHHYESRDIL